MTNSNITIKQYRTYSYYPYRVFEMEIEVNGKIIYANMDVLHKGNLSVVEIKESDSYWFYDTPLTEIDDYFDKNCIELLTEEIEAVLNLMVQLWNENPVFVDDEKWVIIQGRNWK